MFTPNNGLLTLAQPQRRQLRGNLCHQGTFVACEPHQKQINTVIGAKTIVGMNRSMRSFAAREGSEAPPKFTSKDEAVNWIQQQSATKQKPKTDPVADNKWLKSSGNPTAVYVVEHQGKSKALRKKDEKDIDLALDRIARNHPEAANLATHVRSAYDGFEHNGLTTKVTSTSIHPQKGKVTVGGHVEDKNGNRVGIFQRGINYETKTTEHYLFEMHNTGQQGKGFGAAFTSNQEKAYLQAGMKEVKLTANLSVGGYAWAALGYDFNDGATPQMKKTWSRQHKAKFGVDAKMPTHAYDVAKYKGPDGSRFGKDFLLGSEWNASKKLNPNDPGYQQGREYYRLKGVD